MTGYFQLRDKRDFSMSLCLSSTGIVIGRCIMKTLPCDGMKQAAVSILTLHFTIHGDNCRPVENCVLSSGSQDHCLGYEGDKGDRREVIHCPLLLRSLILSSWFQSLTLHPGITSLYIFDNDGIHDQTTNNYRVNHRGFSSQPSRVSPQLLHHEFPERVLLLLL